jgi:hypothetical protein
VPLATRNNRNRLEPGAIFLPISHSIPGDSVTRSGVERYQRGLGMVMSVFNLAVWQCLLEFLQTLIGDPRVIEAQMFKSGQPSEVLQPGVCDRGAVEE